MLLLVLLVLLGAAGAADAAGAAGAADAGAADAADAADACPAAGPADAADVATFFFAINNFWSSLPSSDNKYNMKKFNFNLIISLLFCVQWTLSCPCENSTSNKFYIIFKFTQQFCIKTTKFFVFLS